MLTFFLFSQTSWDCLTPHPHRRRRRPALAPRQSRQQHRRELICWGIFSDVGECNYLSLAARAQHETGAPLVVNHRFIGNPTLLLPSLQATIAAAQPSLMSSSLTHDLRKRRRNAAPLVSQALLQCLQKSASASEGATRIGKAPDSRMSSLEKSSSVGHRAHRQRTTDTLTLAPRVPVTQ